MLFPLNPQTQQCAVFDLLNNELLHFLEASITANSFSQNLFTVFQFENETLPSVCWSNEPTRSKFSTLWEKLPVDAAGRQQLFDDVSAAQDISSYFSDVNKPLPALSPDELYTAFKELTTHLFTRTKDLEGAKNQSGSSIEQHYQAHVVSNGNSHLCFICGTALLSQNRFDLSDDDQWRSDYDHLLCKDKYPVFGVHPGNFIPTCHICNSKAKGARDLLKCEGPRRTAFYPLPPSQDACEFYAQISIEGLNIDELVASGWDSPLVANVDFNSAPAHLTGKIDVWSGVYQVPLRVKEKIISDFYERVSSDLLAPQSFDDFKSLLHRRVNQTPADIRKAEWRFWWQGVYEFMNNQSDDFLQVIWSLIDWKRQQANDDDMMATFGV